VITHVFFELPGVLADPARLRASYPMHLGVVMAGRYGSTPDTWANAYIQVREDWDSYWSDLNLKGDKPLADLWEGLFRTTRALFRLAQVAEPDKDELIPFSRVLPGLVLERFDALYPQARGLLESLGTEGVFLHVATHWTVGAARGLLAGGGVSKCCSEPIIGIDVTEVFDKNYAYLALKVGASPESCLVVDTDPDSLERARNVRMQTVLMQSEDDLEKVLTVPLNNRFLPKKSSGIVPLLR
jgi:phosphoglycolate phosphatase-like HAD superfamily hydrolase